jgi:hypothetical protein
MQGVWRFQDLVAWKLAFELKQKADALCQRPAIRRDYKFHAQLADSAASGPRNIAEGFGHTSILNSPDLRASPERQKSKS